ncbi:MAG: response regulator [Planctomycetes bacterium]|nr:response regulator [Planctomycetota bacterium]
MIATEERENIDTSVDMEGTLKDIKDDIRNVRAWKSLTHKIVDKIDALEAENSKLSSKLSGIRQLLGDMPVEEEVPEKKVSLKATLSNIMKRNVLIVDSDDGLRAMMKQALSFGGYTTIAVSSPREAFAVLESEVIDAMVFDTNAEGVDGISFYRQLRSMPATATLPVMICTEKRTRTDVLDAKELKTVAYLAKPFKMDVLFSKLEKLLKTAT